MISQEDFSVISRLDSGDQASRDKVAKEAPQQCAKTLYNLLGHISKDQTVQYLLTLVDDFLQEDKARVAIFRDYSRKRKESVWAAFLNLLNRPDGFIQNMTSRYCRVVNLMKIADVIDGEWWMVNLIVQLMSF